MDDESVNATEVFRHSTMNRISNADELDHYIKVTNPSAWAIVLAALLLVAGVIVWAIVAIVPVTINTTGVMLEHPETVDKIVICWVDESTADKIAESGATASIDGVEAKNVQVSDVPQSASEVIHFLGSDFYIDSLNLSDWNYLVTVDPSGSPRHSDFTINTHAGAAHLAQVSIVVLETQPINIVLGNK